MMSNKFSGEMDRYGTTVFKKYLFDFTNSDDIADANDYYVLFTDGTGT